MNDFITAIALISFIALTILTFVKIINLVFFVQQKPLYDGNLVLIFLGAGIIFWGIYFLSSHAALQFSETITSTQGADITTIAFNNNAYNAFFDFLFVANVFFVIIITVSLCEFAIQATVTASNALRGRYKKPLAEGKNRL